MPDHTPNAPAFKTCTKCEKSKPLAEFSKDKSKSTGLAPSCRTCQQERYRANYVPHPRPSAEVRFWKLVDKRSPDECWPWLGATRRGGYGQFWDGKSNRGAHGYSFELHNGPLPEGQLPCHSCDNPICVNPKHLFAGTQADNVHDMIAKGRRYQPDASGEKNGRAILNEDKVRVARSKHKAGASVTSLAREYSVGWSTMAAALRGETWPNV
jgi:hypothetical protein